MKDKQIDLKLIIPGQPAAQKRHRTGRGGRRYDPSSTDKKRIRKELLQIKPVTPITKPVRVEINAFVQTPKSWSGAKQERYEGRYRPKRPDADNYSKLILDSMSGMIYTDDGQVVDLRTRKFYSMKPCTELQIEIINEKTK